MIIIALALLALAGCESGASFKVINKSRYPLYVSINEESQVQIPAMDERTWDVDTDTQYFIGGEVKQKVHVVIKGETYKMYDKNEEEYVDSTYVYLKVGEDRKAYIWPNRAGIKINNDSSQTMRRAKVFKHDGVVEQFLFILEDLDAGDSVYKTLDFATPSNNFYYYAQIMMEDGTEYIYGDASNILRVDEQFLIVLADPGRQAAPLTKTFIK